jgi:two-component system, cell cycle sensor histidine kinase and response regulator CckA
MTTGWSEAAALRRDLDDARGRIAALEQELAQARRLESIGRLTVSVAHDLRNVMAAMAGQTELLLGELGGESAMRRRVEAIRRATGWGERLTRELLAAGRPPSSAPEVADLNAVISGVVRMLAPLLGGEVEVRLELEPRVGAVAVGAAALEQLAMNLILNARDAMPDGGCVTVCTAVAAEINGAGEEAPALLRVQDTGVGMDEATRARAFEPYFTTKAAGKGTGLGLSTVHDVVTRHGGHVEIQSAPGRGTTFTVTLPRAAAAAAGPAVLVVEEETGVRELIVEILELHDFQALPARDHGEAERLSVAHAGPLALVIAGAGADVTRRVDLLRRARPETRVLYLSDRVEDVRTAGSADPTLAKPFSVDGLVRKVREVLDAPTG